MKTPRSADPQGRARRNVGGLFLLVVLLCGAEGADAQRPGAGQVNPDTARARVLERLRETSRVYRDSVAAADSIQADSIRGDSISGAGAPLGVQVGSQGTTQVELPPRADSVMRALFALPGYTLASYQAGSADYDANGRRLFLLAGDSIRPRFSGQGVRLEADSSIIYDDALGIVRTTGQTYLIPDQGEPVESRTLIYDVNAARGTALGARTTYSEGASWIVDADMDWVSDGVLFGSDARFTSCDLPEPHSYFEAKSLKVLAGQVLIARSVRMYVDDVPVLWLPFIAQNLGSGRASGILTPSFSVNDIVRTSTGYNRRLSNLGYYWAMSEYSDATLAMDWWANNYTALEGSFRYRWARRFLSGGAVAKQYWRENGNRELSFRTQHSWDVSERTQARVNATYVSSTSFVTQNSFTPTELNQTIDSDGGINHRFGWGSLSLSANRRQYLSDERVDMTLPSVNLSLSTLTLFDAPPSEASWYNNVSLSGSMGMTRNVNERAFQPDTAFTLNQASGTRTVGNASGRVGVGNLNLNTRVELEESVLEDVPGALRGGTVNTGEVLSGRWSGNGLSLPWEEGTIAAQEALDRADFQSGRARWSADLSYQQRLIGNSSITPNVSFSGDFLRVDSIPEALDYVAGPQRVSVGVGLQTEIYGFYPGVAGFEAIRHKLTPSASYAWSPEVTPTELQRRVFGARVARPTRLINLTLNQTWEAKVPEPETPVGEGEPGEGPPSVPEDEDLPGDIMEEEEAEFAEADDERVIPTIPPARSRDEDPDGPRRLPRSQVVTLLALQTSSITYDMVEADSTGMWLDGFTSTRLQNTIRSDYLRGLDLSFEHELFPDRGFEPEEARSFAPHLSQLSLGFALSDQSAFVRFLGRLLGFEPPVREQSDPPEGGRPPDVAAGFFGGPEGMDPNRVTSGPGAQSGMGFMSGGRREGWDARIRYSLRRPREGGVSEIASSLRSQTLQGSLSFSPSPNWTADWNTSFDVEENRFLDHVVSLRRDLHEWEAIFGFRQTATGNWQFQFEVALKANRELRFDYEQRSLEGQGGTGFPGTPF